MSIHGEYIDAWLMYRHMVDDTGWMYQYRVDVSIEDGCIDTW